MCINFSCANGAVFPHFLNAADSYILLQQKGSKGMAEHMRGNMLLNIGQLSIMIYHTIHGLVGQLFGEFKEH